MWVISTYLTAFGLDLERGCDSSLPIGFRFCLWCHALLVGLLGGNSILLFLFKNPFLFLCYTGYLICLEGHLDCVLKGSNTLEVALVSAKPGSENLLAMVRLRAGKKERENEMETPVVLPTRLLGRSKRTCLNSSTVLKLTAGGAVTRLLRTCIDGLWDCGSGV